MCRNILRRIQFLWLQSRFGSGYKSYEFTAGPEAAASAASAAGDSTTFYFNFGKDLRGLDALDATINISSNNSKLFKHFSDLLRKI